ncbi:MAG TPA: glycosyltransferase family 4 protein [Myxococcales bacterium]|nr:glycosyltransferase family 4 protein [Myxococcales bacterium]
MRGGIWVVLHLDAKKRGSGEQQLVALAQRLQRENVPVTMVFSAEPAPYPGHELRGASVDVRWVDYTRPTQALAKLAKWFAAARPALAHFHFIDPYSPYVSAAKLAGAQVLVHDHLCPAVTPGLRGVVKRARSMVLNSFVDLRVAVSRYVADAVVQAYAVAPDHVVVVENGIDMARFRGIGGESVRTELNVADVPLVVCVSRLDREKGGETLLRSVPLFARGAHLVFAGEGPRLSDWKDLVAKLGVAKRVHFVGLRNDVEHLIAAANVVVVPSEYEEAFGQVVVEGMASARPVVVTRSGAMPDLVRDAGIVVPKRDPEALAEAVNAILGDRKLATRLGRLGRERAESHFGMDQYVDRMVALYRYVLDSNQRAA